jgi:hypothetical protein
MPKLKTLEEQLVDANEIIRRKNAQEIDYKRTIAALQREEDTAQAIRQELYGLSAHSPEPPTWISGRGGKIGSRGCPVTMWSDTHYGEQVSLDETNGVNKYNKDIAKKRMFRLFDTTVDLAFNHMGRAKTEYPGIVVMLGGDMIGGDIHEELLATNDRTPQQAVNDLTDILGAGLEKMASKFGKVFVPSVVGNHGRSTRKPRMKGRVYTNYDWSIYTNLERYFRKEKHIQLYVPPSADAQFKIFHSRYLLTHGDSMGVAGGDGIIGAIGPIMRGAIKIGRAEAQMGRDFDHLVMGHWHQMLWLPNLTVNNAVKGYDEYAMLKLRAPYSRPSQALWFEHPEHGVTARWEIFLEGLKKGRSAPWISFPDLAKLGVA